MTATRQNRFFILALRSYLENRACFSSRETAEEVYGALLRNHGPSARSILGMLVNLAAAKSRVSRRLVAYVPRLSAVWEREGPGESGGRCIMRTGAAVRAARWILHARLVGAGVAIMKFTGAEPGIAVSAISVGD